MSTREIIADKLVKKFENFTAVDGVSFHVKAGEIFGFLGPNGAGKSTTVTMLTTLILPTGGKATVGGYDVVNEAQKVRRIAGVALQDIGLDPIMKSMELLTMQGRAFGMSIQDARKRADELLEIVGLSEFKDRRTGKYSGGMRRRLDLALSLVHKPDILFLDEPTTGLDPLSRREVWREVRRLNREYNMTIFLTTQYLEEADELADRIAIINRGQIAVEGQPQALKAALGGESVNLTFRETEQAEKAGADLRGMFNRIQLDRRTIRLYRNDAAQIIPTVVTRLNALGLEPISLTLTQPTLDDVFLQVTGSTIAPTQEEATEETRSIA